MYNRALQHETSKVPRTLHGGNTLNQDHDARRYDSVSPQHDVPGRSKAHDFQVFAEAQTPTKQWLIGCLGFFGASSASGSTNFLPQNVVRGTN